MAGSIEDFHKCVNVIKTRWPYIGRQLDHPLAEMKRTKIVSGGKDMETKEQRKNHTTTWRVTYRMSDQMGVVYYGNYFEMFEFGRTELLRATGFSYADMERDGYFLPVTRASAEYLAPARYDDLLEIQTAIDRFDRLRIEFEYEIRRAGEPGLICRGATKHIFTGSDGKPRRLGPDWLKRIQALME